MKFLGKDIDEASLEKIKSFMNTDGGSKLKKQIENLSQEDIKKLIDGAKHKNFDEKKLKELLSKSPDEILKHVDINKFK